MGYGRRTWMRNDYCILHLTTEKVLPLRMPGYDGENVSLYDTVQKKAVEVKVMGLGVFVGLRETDTFSLLDLKAHGEDERGGKKIICTIQ